MPNDSRQSADAEHRGPLGPLAGPVLRPSPRIGLGRGTAALGSLLFAGLAVFAAAPSAVGLAPSGSVSVSASAQGRPDQVYVVTRGNVAPISGTVRRNDLDKVVLDQGGREREWDTSRVVRVSLGRVPATYSEGAALLARGEAAEAAKSFALAASDAEASEVARAAARLRSAEALYQAGAKDHNRFAEAAAEAARFLADHGQNREVPAARLLEARALWAAGDGRAALERYRGLFAVAQGTATPAGYGLSTVLEAGLEGAHAALAAKDIAAARELLLALETPISEAIAKATPGDPAIAGLESMRASLLLGEGHVLLAEGRAPQAETFFRGQLSAESSLVRHRAGLGLALALEGQGKLRPAQVEFARYAALGVGDPQGVARALLGAAETSLALSDTDAREQARQWLESLLRGAPGPHSKRAQDLLRTL